MDDFLKNIAQEAIKKISRLGQRGRENITTDSKDHARNCIAEKVVGDYVIGRVRKQFGYEACITIEGFGSSGPIDAWDKFVCDPMDGTAYYARQRSLSPPDITMTLAHIVGDKPRYADVREGVIANIGTREIIHAFCTTPTCSTKYGQLRAGVNEKDHVPIIATDFFFPQNAEARLKLRHLREPEWVKFECLNTGSVAGMLAGVATGDLTAFFNLVGPTPLELAPGYLAIRNAGGYVLSADDGNSLALRHFSLEEKRVPIVAACDEETAKKIYEKIKA